MKKYYLLIFISLCLFACAPKRYLMGMTEADFLKENRSAINVYQTSVGSVYRIDRMNISADPGSKFYYFRNGKLVKIDAGVAAPDIVIQRQ